MSKLAGQRRFAIVAPNFHPRICGIGDHSVRLAAELMRRGHQVVAFSRDPVERHPEVPDLEAYGVPGTIPLATAQGIARAIDERQPTDVILQYTPQMWNAGRLGSPAPLMVASRARQAGARVTLIAHEPFVPWYRRPDLMLGAALQRFYFAALLRVADHAFVTTQTRLRYVEPYTRALGLPPAGVTRIGANALPLERVAHGGGPRIGIFSTAAVGKRFDVVLDAFAEISREIPSAELVLIGDLGPPDRPEVAQIQRILHRHPARDHIRVTGRLSLPAIAREIAALNVYLFTTDTGANTRSCTLPVALGTGLPVVAIAGLETDADLFRDGETLLVARSLDAPAFAEGVLRALRDPALAARVGAGARRLYDEHLSWPRIVDELLAVIGSA